MARNVAAGLSILLLLGASACVSTSQVERLASAGASYGRAMDALLAAAEEAAVDADSERLLSEGEGVSARSTREEILEKHAAIAETVRSLEVLRRHARALERYFAALGNLVEGKAEAEVETAVGRAADALDRVGQQVSGSKLLKAEEKEALGRLVHLAVGAAVRQAVRRELEARGAAIEQQLRIQKAVLDAVREQIKADRRSQLALGRERQIHRPYVENDIRDPDGWVVRRRSYLLKAAKPDPLEGASEAASKLHLAWQAHVEGRFDDAAQRDLLREIANLVAAAESVKAAL